MRRRWDYFVQQLLGAEPPKEYQMQPLPPAGRAREATDDAGAPRPAMRAGCASPTGWPRSASLALAFSGVEILMVHPRLYWGEAGNDLTPAAPGTADQPQPPAWRLDCAGAVLRRRGGAGHGQPHLRDLQPERLGPQPALPRGVVPGRERRGLSADRPGRRATSAAPRARRGADCRRARSGAKWPTTCALRDTRRDWRPAITACCSASPISPSCSWRCRSSSLTGMTMSPAIAAAYPVLLNSSVGISPRARIHFAAFVALMLFLVVHVVMVAMSGFRRQMRAMTIGRTS